MKSAKAKQFANNSVNKKGGHQGRPQEYKSIYIRFFQVIETKGG
jgi:hypothetical protein